jgi:hypothetical protein
MALVDEENILSWKLNSSSELCSQSDNASTTLLTVASLTLS